MQKIKLKTTIKAKFKDFSKISSIRENQKRKILHVECQSRGTAAYSGNDCEAAIIKAK